MLLISVFAACATDDPGVGFVSPFDGQTDWPHEAPLQLRLTGDSLPEGYPTPQDLVRVVDLDDGGFVPGSLSHDGVDLWFYPDQPFAADHDFVAHIDPASLDNREPELDGMVGLDGETVFSTASRLDALDAVVDAAGVLCVLWSRAPADGEFVSVAVDGVAVVVGAPRPADVPGIDPTQGQGQRAQCTQGTSVAEGAGVRVQVGVRVWQFEAIEMDVEVAAEGRYRVQR